MPVSPRGRKQPAHADDMVPEHDNPHDPNAVGVWINWLKVGHLSRYDACECRPGLLALQDRHGGEGRKGLLGVSAATIWPTSAYERRPSTYRSDCEPLTRGIPVDNVSVGFNIGRIAIVNASYLKIDSMTLARHQAVPLTNFGWLLVIPLSLRRNITLVASRLDITVPFRDPDRAICLKVTPEIKE